MVIRVALVVPTLWGLLAGAALAGQGDLFTTIWFAFGLLACPAAVAVIATTPRPTARRVWLWAIAPIPAAFAGPLALATLFVPPIRRDLRQALTRRPVSRWAPAPDRPPRSTTAPEGPPAAPAVALAMRSDTRLAIEKLVAEDETTRLLTPLEREWTKTAPDADVQAGVPAVPAQPAAPPRPKPLLALVGLVIGSVVAGAVAFIGLLLWVVLAGGDYTGPKSGGHYLYPHTYQVVLLLSACVAAAGVAVSTLVWLESGSTTQRLAIALALAALALASIAGLTGFMYGQGGPDPRPANVARPTVTGGARVGVRLKADEGVWDTHAWTPSNDCLRHRGCYVFSFAWQRCAPRALSCRTIRGATGETELVEPDLVGYQLRVMVTAENDAGSRSARSRPTAIVVRG